MKTLIFCALMWGALTLIYAAGPDLRPTRAPARAVIDRGAT